MVIAVKLLPLILQEPTARADPLAMVMAQLPVDWG
jgi:hypothetical protein